MIKNFCALCLAIIFFSCGDDETSQRKNKWTEMKDFPGGPRAGMFSFSFNGRGYAGGGNFSDSSPNEIIYRDLWEYTPEKDQWTKKGDLPYAIFATGQAFTIGNKVYLMTFGTAFFEYDPLTDKWTEKAPFPDYRNGQAAFALNGKIYAGLGYNTGNSSSRYNDWWEYNPATDVWNRKSDVPFEGRTGAASWSTATIGYVGFGFAGDVTEKNDSWEYDQATDKWVEKSTEGIPPFSGALKHGFSIDNIPFLTYPVNGALNFLFEYDAQNGKWVPASSLGTEFEHEYTLFTVGKSAYLVGGYSGNGGITFSDQVKRYEY